MQLFRTFAAAEIARGLATWSFIDLDGKEPLFTSPFGDVFFAARDGYWYLSLIDGELSREWNTHAEMEAALNTEAGDDSFLLGALAHAAESNGIVPNASEVYDFLVAPIIGGSFGIENLGVANFVAKLNIAGQLFTQIRDLPPRSTVDRFDIS